MYHIYIIQNLVNLKIYVGFSNDPKLRWSTHLSCAKYGKKNYPIYNAIRKYGKKSFSMYVIESFTNSKEALEAEQFWIEYFQTNIAKHGDQFGYNLTVGGEDPAGMKHSQKTKNKISKSLLGNKNNLGNKASLETKKKMSAIHLGEKNAKAKLAEKDVLHIREYHQKHINTSNNVFKELLKIYEKHKLTISCLEKIIYRNTWKHI